MLNRKIISSKKDWGTPLKYVNAVKEVFDNIIELDPCSNEYSIVNAKKEIQPPENGLAIDWDYKTIYVNPPYGRDKNVKTNISDWLKKCSDSYEKYNNEILALIPVSTNTKHWKENIFKRANGICFLEDTRLKFLNKGIEEKKGAPISCTMIYWGNNYNKFKEVFSKYGKCFKIILK